jgi:hypothetical protein
MEARAAELLPVPYFHVVFTIPETIAAVALQNRRVVYDILFRAAAETLLEVAADPRHLGAKIGFLAVLHTWGQNLLHHPHVHCVVPGGGIAADGSKWIAAREKFFLPVRVLSRVFRGKFIALLKRAFVRGELEFHGSLADMANPGAWQHLLDHSVRTEWAVYAKPPFGGPETVLKYLSRYTHRVAISNHRLVHLQEGQVAFRLKDYALGGRRRTMTLDAVEFIRRFLLHVLPGGFMRIRHFGFMANRFRSENLALCRKLLGTGESEPPEIMPDQEQAFEEPATACGKTRCPLCRQGQLRTIRHLRAERGHRTLARPPTFPPAHCDTS